MESFQLQKTQIRKCDMRSTNKDYCMSRSISHTLFSIASLFHTDISSFIRSQFKQNQLFAFQA